MAGTKRSWDGQPLQDEPNPIATHTTQPPQQPPTMASAPPAAEEPPANPIITMFETFRDELDEHHDRRERLIKISRDITALSKKIIFSLQRIRTLPTPLPPSISKETTTRFAQINTLFQSALPEFQHPPNFWRYQRSLSPGIQEFIEAVSFHHYLTTQTLITKAEVAERLPAGILVTDEDYLMGLFDFTGEVMRFAVTGLSAGASPCGGQGGKQGVDGDGDGDETETGTEIAIGKKLPTEQAGIVVDLRGMRSAFEGLTVTRRHTNMFRDLGKKVDVMQNSVEKVERAAYGILVRGSERPKGWRPDLAVAAGGDDY
ncbi:Translin [Aspergillus heteromorphus CBS 117.55]|uniref:Translin n=1 Tax=Aspergillus heteromorphus CBS 117.55 TaxID=1448321 RepID=A0A317VRU0_9EURO|nr:Translin [Aspergillus heteromorphus CBS 117.55]PWY77033.1 Translin [Aspergillus heteromorphus CBS 117.55]